MRPGNGKVAALLDRFADLLEIEEGNPFRIRAYRNAARVVRDLGTAIADRVEAGDDLTELPSIGKDIAGLIGEFVRTGGVERLKELEQRFPATLVELTRLDGVGPKRARQLYESLGIASTTDLQNAIQTGALRGVKGFGARTEERIARALKAGRTRDRLLLADADQYVEPLLAWMRATPGLEIIEAAGSYRRRAETVGDLDLLAIGARAAPIIRRFVEYPDVDTVVAAGSTRASVTLQSGVQVDLRVVPARAYGAALHYFTGSKDHNVAIRQRGVARGLRISEYGIFRVSDAGEAESDDEEGSRRIGGATEEEVFAAVGLSWITPELREARGEIEAAERGALPDLITFDAIRGDLHTHSTWSDGKDSIEAMALAARGRGYEYMAVADHSPSITIARGIGPRELERQWQEIDGLADVVSGLRILKGMEVDILRDGTLDLPDEMLGRLDIVIVSVHSLMQMSRPEMTRRIIRAIEHPAVHILGHPTGRRLGRREAYDVDLDAVFRAAAALGVAVEINSLPQRLDLKDVHARRARELGTAIVIDTDAHSTGALRFMAHGVDQARRGWLTAQDVLNTRSLDELLEWLAMRSKGADAGVDRT
ncbi:MAG: DNA polymerase/3'-5' exonuclease PolX [Longimicrobiales bacterium]